MSWTSVSRGRWLIAGLIVALVAGLGRPAVGLTQARQTGIPSISETDGRFLGIAGTGLRTVAATSTTSVYIAVPAGQAGFTIEVFDGDLGGRWDNVDPSRGTTPRIRYALFADPNRDGSGRQAIVSRTDQDFSDNTWQALFSGAPDPAARAPSGNYFYRLEVGWVDPSQTATEFNGFKVRSDAEVSVGPGSWAFAGAPINVGVDPGFGTAGNRYDGTWQWYVFVPTGADVTIRECDADLRTDPMNPGIPPDDDPNDARVRIPPDVRYSLTAPDGTLVQLNTTPSGNDVCQTRTFTSRGAGLYTWSWFGVDAHNLIFVELTYRTFGAAVTPLPVTAATATPTPTSTGTAAPSVTATATSTGTPAAPDTPTPTGTPATPGTPTLTATAPPPTATPTPASSSGGGGGGGGQAAATEVPATPTAQPTAVPTVAAAPTLEPLATPAGAREAGTAGAGPAEAATDSAETGVDQTGADTDPAESSSEATLGAGTGKGLPRAPGQSPAQVPGGILGALGPADATAVRIGADAGEGGLAAEAIVGW